ncbi:alpha/beta hydrolase family protein [Portibacter marinus]|uniref:alpha/beta hydrolase family protein n=1 Tax=Portibacter marinus TaxID=2898660 RepID=UPI001F16C495|nr:alpha/beta fold hydrolase [Portibacter marinus]
MEKEINITLLKLLFILITTLACSFAAHSQTKQQLYQSSEVSYHNDEIQIAATLYQPLHQESFPAVVIVHGSGSSSRDNLWTSAYAESLIKRGIAVLYPDKRGSGKTTGNWVTSDFTELSEDAIAGVHYLKGISGVDTSRIGVIGFSQGGHIVPLAASISTDIKFVVSVSASVVPMVEQMMDEVELMAEKEGLNRLEIEKVNEINQLAINAALNDTDGQDYIDALNKAKNGALKGKRVVEGFPTDLNQPAKTFIKTIGNYDPMPYWMEVNIPILFVYGGKDENIRISKSINLIEKSLSQRDSNYSLLLFNKNGHALYREDLLDFMARWIFDKGSN